MFGTLGRLQRRVVACNQNAAAQGVRVGMPLVEVRKDFQGVSLPVDLQADHEALEDLAIQCQRFTPITGIQTSDPYPASNDVILMDVTKTCGLFGGEVAIANEVQQFMRRQGFQAHLAIADSVAAAWAIAHHQSFVASLEADLIAAGPESNQPQSPQDSGTKSTKQEKANASGICVATAHTQAQIILQLPVSALRLEDAVLSDLDELGLQKIGQLLKLPAASLPSRFGSTTSRRIAAIQDQVDEMIQVCRQSSLYQWQHSLEHPTNQLEVIQAYIELSIHKTVQPIRQKQEGVLSLVCQLFSKRKPPVELTLKLVQPTLDVAYLMQLLQLQLERQPLPKEITHVQISVPVTVAYRPKQQWLFQEDEQNRIQKRSGLIERLSSRLGTSAVLQVRLQSQALPERNYVPRKRITIAAISGKKFDSKPKSSKAGKASGKKSVPSTTITPAALERPTRLYHQPKRLKLLSETKHPIVERSRFWVPANFQMGSQAFEVQQAVGPERIESQWWEGRWVRRDYYRVQTKTGLRLWIFQQVDSHQWYAHGDFA